MASAKSSRGGNDRRTPKGSDSSTLGKSAIRNVVKPQRGATKRDGINCPSARSSSSGGAGFHPFRVNNKIRGMQFPGLRPGLANATPLGSSRHSAFTVPMVGFGASRAPATAHRSVPATLAQELASGCADGIVARSQPSPDPEGVPWPAPSAGECDPIGGVLAERPNQTTIDRPPSSFAAWRTCRTARRRRSAGCRRAIAPIFRRAN